MSSVTLRILLPDEVVTAEASENKQGVLWVYLRGRSDLTCLIQEVG